MLENFQSSFAAREYWNKASSTSKAPEFAPEFAAAEPVNRLG